MKTLSKLLIFTGLFMIVLSSTAQEKYFSNDAEIHFLSKALIENIEAVNNEVICVVDIESGEIAFKVPIKKFEFEKSLMQEHFNENYMESDKYPYATFSGTFNYMPSADIKEILSTEVEVTGELTIHGVTKTVTETGTIELIEGNVVINSDFVVALKDYNVKIPKIMFQNIAQRLTLAISGSLQPYEN